jgi:hypothetical protein
LKAGCPAILDVRTSAHLPSLREGKSLLDVLRSKGTKSVKQ